MTTSPQVTLDPNAKLAALDEAQRAAVAALVEGDDDAVAALWADKLRRFASLYGRNLGPAARARFGAEAATQLLWMADLLLTAAERSAFAGTAPLDQAHLNAALYCLDAAKAPAAARQRAEQLLARHRDWLLTDAPQPALVPSLGSAFAYRSGLWAREAAAIEEQDAGHGAGVAILCPSPFSLYALTVFELCRRLDIPVKAVVLRKFTFKRFQSEWRRDGTRLLKKILRKLILKSDENADVGSASAKAQLDALAPPAADVRKMAKGLGIPVIEVESFDEAVAPLEALSPALGLFCGGGLLSERFLQVFARGAINVHMGPLPRYKGMDVVQAPILEGCFDEVGLTAHFIVRGLDAGPAILKFSTSARGHRSLGALRNTVTALMPLMLMDACLGSLSGRLQAQPQPQPEAGRHYYIVHPSLLASIDAVLAHHAGADDGRPEPIAAEIAAFRADPTIFPPA